MNDIKSFKPFLAIYRNYSDEYDVYVRFTCSKCGSHNVSRRRSLHFFEGNFSCADCGYGIAEDGFPINYYSSCFHFTKQDVVEQLTLF